MQQLLGLVVIAVVGSGCATSAHRVTLAGSPRAEPAASNRTVINPAIVAGSEQTMPDVVDRAPLAIALEAPAPPPPPPPVPAPQLATGAPHLVIVDARLVPTGKCYAKAAMLDVHAWVENRGDATFPGAPAYGLVGADMTRFGSMMGNGGTVPPIEAGATVEITFPIFYPGSTPDLLARTTRYELKLDRYGYFPATEMDQRILVRTLPRPLCSPEPSAVARD